MPRRKRTSAPAPMEFPPPPGAHLVPPATAPSMFGPGAWCPPFPPQSMAASSTPYWFPGLQHPGMPGSLPQGSWCAPPSSANMEDSDLQVLGVDSNPPGGLLNFLNKNTPKHGPAQAGINGSSLQPINVGDDTHGSACPRTEKRMLWTKDEDITLVGAWLNNSNDPIFRPKGITPSFIESLASVLHFGRTSWGYQHPMSASKQKGLSPDYLYPPANLQNPTINQQLCLGYSHRTKRD
ncbi:unnamed protein product [Urochloa humidicola]